MRQDRPRCLKTRNNEELGSSSAPQLLMHLLLKMACFQRILQARGTRLSHSVPRDLKRFAWPRNASSGKDLQTFRPPTLLPGFKDGSLVPTNSKVLSSIIQTPPITQTGGNCACSRLVVLALLNVALSRSHSVNHPLFSGQGHIFSTASKIKKDSIQLETTPSLFGMSLTSHPL